MYATTKKRMFRDGGFVVYSTQNVSNFHVDMKQTWLLPPGNGYHHFHNHENLRSDINIFSSSLVCLLYVRSSPLPLNHFLSMFCNSSCLGTVCWITFPVFCFLLPLRSVPNINTSNAETREPFPMIESGEAAHDELHLQGGGRSPPVVAAVLQPPPALRRLSAAGGDTHPGLSGARLSRLSAPR